MENEIIEEILINDINESVDGSELVDSVEEVETAPEISQDELVDALLSLINERSQDLDQEEETEEVEDEPTIVTVHDDSTIDYSDLLSNGFDTLGAELLSINENTLPETTIDTPISQYSLTNFLLFIIIAFMFMSMCFKLIRDFMLHI